MMAGVTPRLLPVHPPKKAYDGIYNRLIKRFLGLIVAFPFLIVALPLYIVISIAILIEDGRPVFYRPLRGGYKNKPFRIFKFRTMVKNADKIIVIDKGTVAETGRHQELLDKNGIYAKLYNLK